MTHNNLWKPDKETVVSLKKYKEMTKPPRNTTKKKQKRINRKKTKENRKNARTTLIKHFGLHQHATNIAICFCIHKESGIRMPDREKLVNRMIVDYARNITQDIGYLKYKYMPPNEFYSSKKWREVRYIALQQADGTCTLCGATAKDGVKLHVDHIVPRSKAPQKQFDLDNLQILCEDCNMGKSNYDDTDWR